MYYNGKPLEPSEIETLMKELVDRIVAVNDWTALRKLRALSEVASREMLDRVTDHLVIVSEGSPLKLEGDSECSQSVPDELLS